jgi:hypothetical protein
MSWDYRGKGGPSYTRVRKVAGKVIRECFGRGPQAEREAALDAEKRAWREAQWTAQRAERAARRAADDPLLSLCSQVDLLLKATLVTAGYRQHHRSEWRPWKPFLQQASRRQLPMATQETQSSAPNPQAPGDFSE